MTLDDLARLICETQNVDGFKCTCPVPFEPDWCNGNRAKAQARAVVRALRDEFGRIMEPSDDWNRMGVVDVFNEILGDAGEKVAGGSSRDASKATEASGARCATPCASAPATDPIRDAVAMARGRVLVVDDIPMLNKLAAAMKPATDAAPAVCAWEKSKFDAYKTTCSGSSRLYHNGQRVCPSCGNPIKFTAGDGR